MRRQKKTAATADARKIEKTAPPSKVHDQNPGGFGLLNDRSAGKKIFERDLRK